MGAPSAPSWLPDEAKKLWRRLAPKLNLDGRLTQNDLEAFASLCVAWANVKSATEEIKLHGVTMSGGEHGPERVKNPACQILRENIQAYRTLAKEFGLTPLARGKIRPGDGGKDAVTEMRGE